MLVLRVGAERSRPGAPVMAPGVETGGHRSETLTLEDVLEELSLHPRSLWGLYLRVGAPELLGASLSSLLKFYNSEQLYRPVWVGMEPHVSYNTQEFVSTVEQLFPYCTMVLNEALPVPGLSQRLAVHLPSVHLSSAGLTTGGQELHIALRAMETCDVIVETEQRSRALTEQRSGALTEQRSGALTEQRSRALTEQRSGALTEQRSGALTEQRSGALTEQRSGALTEQRSGALTEQRSGALTE
ncbi:uncharacterized protein [Eucyclogobius newberryi]|uniref:uncharacterized protein n=1 Tax=Eucyclogobius newberryi TaxID=166745 RepID=UPI003B5AE303